jgi:predicted dehydrogenase
VTAEAGSRVTVGLVGCGIWGRNILRDLRALGCGVVVVDVDPANREKAGEGGGVRVFGALADAPPVDGFVVATPATTHAAVVADLLGRGVPIFCEKPLTTDPASAAALVAAGGDRLFVMHVWRYHRGILRLGEMARSGELGPVLSLRTERKNWTSPRTDTDSVWTLVPHDLTIGLAILGAIPAPRFAAVETIDGKPVAMTAILGDESFLSIDCSTRFREKRREVRLHCRDGVAVLPDGESDFIEILREGPRLQPLVERQPLGGEPALLHELRRFVDYLRGGPRPVTDAAEGLAVVRAVAELRRLAGIAGG